MPDSPARPSPWVVLKFGGTSVQSRERWQVIADQVRERLAAGERPVVVCSAIAGVSDALDALPAIALRSGAEDSDGELEGRLEMLEGRHRVQAEWLGVDPAVIAADQKALRRLAIGVALVGETSPQVHARIMAFGELLSTRLGAAFLRAQGIDIAWIDARECLTALPDPDRRPHPRLSLGQLRRQPRPRARRPLRRRRARHPHPRLHRRRRRRPDRAARPRRIRHRRRALRGPARRLAL
jgi:diaminopimelate decarboxylase/aspartate kinase